MKRVIFALGILFSTHSFSQTNIINPFSSFKGYSISIKLYIFNKACKIAIYDK